MQVWIAHFVNANGLGERFRVKCVSLNHIVREKWWCFLCTSLRMWVPTGPRSSVETISGDEVDSVDVIRTSITIYSLSIVQTRLWLALEELKPIFPITIPKVPGPHWAAALSSTCLSQPLSVVLWLQTVSVSPWFSGWWSGFWSSSRLCSAYSTCPRAPGPQVLLLVLLPWISLVLLDWCSLFCPFLSLITNIRVLKKPNYFVELILQKRGQQPTVMLAGTEWGEMILKSQWLSGLSAL